jgi:hypothetical protein
MGEGQPGGRERSSTGGRRPAIPSPGAVDRLLRLGWLVLALLVLQNILGIGLNLYVALPSGPSFVTVFASIPLLTAHVSVAFLLVGLVAYAAFVAQRNRVAGVAWVEGLELLAVVVAVQEGFAFTFTQNNAFSLGMEVAFVGAFATQAVVLYRLARAGRPATWVLAPPAGPATH